MRPGCESENDSVVGSGHDVEQSRHRQGTGAHCDLASLRSGPATPSLRRVVLSASGVRLGPLMMGGRGILGCVADFDAEGLSAPGQRVLKSREIPCEGGRRVWVLGHETHGPFVTATDEAQQNPAEPLGIKSDGHTPTRLERGETGDNLFDDSVRRGLPGRNGRRRPR